MNVMIEICVYLKNSGKPLSYEYHTSFHGYISELLGNDNYGTTVRNYSYSNLCGGVCTKDGIVFHNNPYFLVRTKDDAVWKRFCENINKKRRIADGYDVIGWDLREVDCNPIFFRTESSSPILLPKRFSGDVLSDEEKDDAEKYLVSSVKARAKESGFDIDEGIQIKIVSQFHHYDVNYRGVINKGKNLKLKIISDEKTKEFILLNGLGKSTGIGFGFVSTI